MDREDSQAAAPGVALAAIVAGTAMQLQQAALWSPRDYAAGVVLAVVFAGVAWFVQLRLARGVLIALAVGIGAFAATGWRAAHFAQDALAPALEGRDLLVTGRVEALPHSTDAGLRFRFVVESAYAGSEPVAVPPRILLGWYGGAQAAGDGRAELQRAPPGLRPGERWQLAVRLKRPHGHANPHGFDHELWLWEQGVQATGYVRAGPRDAPPVRLAQTWRHPVELARHAVRDAIFARIADERTAGVVAALAVGDQRSIDRADWDVFRATGVAHLMSISGLHVTMFAWAAAALVGAGWRRSARLCLAAPAPRAALLGGVALAAAYAVFSGWGVPAQRTVFMLATVALLRLGARDWPWPWVWGLAGAVVVVIDPWALLQPGFWLSFVAVGVLFASGPATPEAPRGWRARGGALLREQVVVSVALAPLSLLLFGEVSAVGLPANLVAIPWVTLVVTPLALAGVVAPPLWTVAGWAVGALASGLELLAQWPHATASVPASPAWAGVAAVAGGALLALRLPWPVRAIGVPLLLPALLWEVPRPAPGEFELLAADVGQGNAVLVRTASHALLYDTGPRYGPQSDAGHRVLVPLLRALDVRLDRVVLSHRDADHIGGAPAVLAMQPRADVLASLEPGHPLQSLRPMVPCVAGQAWQWDGVRFEILHPSEPEAAARAARPNTASCVLRVTNGRRAALLAGDIEAAQEAALAASGRALRADWLLAPHHGSRTSSTPALLLAVAPADAVVQAGYRNRFGHPAQDVADRYRRYGVTLHVSDRCGAARWRSDAAGIHCERPARLRYWHHDMR